LGIPIDPDGFRRPFGRRFEIRFSEARVLFVNVLYEHDRKPLIVGDRRSLLGCGLANHLWKPYGILLKYLGRRFEFEVVDVGGF